jgi:IS1 family transposase
MNKLPPEKRAQILGMMVEGVSLRSITRLTGAGKNTLARLLVTAGRACAEYQDKTLHSLKCKRVQVDEIWSFVYAKQKNVPEAKRDIPGYGDIWTWTALDADSKLVLSWLVGDRDGETAKIFVSDIAGRLANKVQLTSDGYSSYLKAVEGAFGADVDFAQLVKVYSPGSDAPGRYSPPACIGAKREPITGNPDPKHISTSFVERQNLTMRMSIRRFTRLTNAFSKKIDNHVHALAIYFMHYNFVRQHQTTRASPAMAAGVTDKLWELSDVVKMIEDWETSHMKKVA